MPALAFAAAAQALAAPQVFDLDPQHSWVHAELLHFGTSTIRVRIGPLRGTVMLDAAAQRGELGLRIDTATVNTGLGFFDARIRQADLLDAASHPEAFFVASQWQFEGGQPRLVRGEFTLRGISRPLELRALRFGCRRDTQRDTEGAQVCGGDFEAEFKRSDFGISFGLPFVGDTVRLQVQAEGRLR